MAYEPVMPNRYVMNFCFSALRMNYFVFCSAVQTCYYLSCQKALRLEYFFVVQACLPYCLTIDYC